MPDLTNEQLSLTLIVVAAVALIALATAIGLGLMLRNVRREYAIVRSDHEEADIMSALGKAMKRIAGLHARVDGLDAELREQQQQGRYALQRFHLVRYDAFEDMGGRLSFSAALLDDHGDGVVITSINGRTETRTYAKPVRRLESPHNLSDEERDAIAGAAGMLERDSVVLQ